MDSNAITQDSVQRRLRSVAAKLTTDAELQKDLLQEMAIHLNSVQNKLPGRTLSWYIKSCEFRARNHLKRGRSVDSRKRANKMVPLDLRTEETVEVGFFSSDSSDTRHLLIAQDLLELITPKLSERQKEVLTLLMDGCGVREAGRKLGISHPAVIKHRTRIARIAREVITDTTPDRELAASVLE
jgi:RNA polymerase sigma factor (sigma-70 family)